MVIGTARFWVSPKPERITKFLPILQSFQSSDRRSALSWQVLLGHMTSLEMFVPGGRLRTRSAQFCLADHWDRGLGPEVLVPVTEGVKYDLLWWYGQGRLSAGRSILVPGPDLHLYTDASTTGWGAAVLMDNMTALSYLRKQGGTSSLSLFLESRRVLELAELLSCRLLPAFVPGDLNVIADRLSRQGQPLTKEWTLHPEVCLNLWRLWGLPHVDLFTTKENFRLPRYVSPIRDSQAWAVDAMLVSWDGLLAYAYPPFALLNQVLAKLRSSRGARLVLIAPFWPRQPWFLQLFHLSVAVPRRLPLRPDLLSQPYVEARYLGMSALMLTAWLLGSECFDRRAFRATLPAESRAMFGPQLSGCTRLGGASSENGVRDAMYRRTLPL